jgi:hypothetical protein
MRTNITFALFLILYLTPALSKNHPRFNLLIGPNWINNNVWDNKFNIGLATSFAYDPKISKHSYLSLGIGFNRYEWTKEYEIDTNFHFVSSPNGCNCEFYNNNMEWSEIFIPIKYKYYILTDNFRIALAAGTDIAIWKLEKHSYQYYFRDQFDQLHPGPFSESYSTKNDLTHNILQKSFSIILSKHVKSFAEVSTEISYTFSRDLRKFRILLGITLGK